MAELLQTELLMANGATLVGYPWNVLGLDQAWVEVQVTASAATLNGTILFGLSVDPAGNFPGAANGTLQNSAPGGISYNAATGLVTITNPAAATTHRMYLRFDRPAKFLRPTWTFGSGGGTFLVRCIGYGWQQNTTP